MTKILSIITLVLSIIYFGVTATLFSYRVNYKSMYEKERQAHQSTRKEMEEEKDKLIKEKGEILNQLAHAEAERQLFKDKTQIYADQLKTNVQEFTRLVDNYTGLHNSFIKVESELNSLKEEYKTLLAEKETEKAERVKFENLYSQELDKNITLSERQGQIEQENAELSKMLVDKTKENEELKEKLQKVKELEIPIPDIEYKKKIIDGIVTAVSNKVNLVLISVGEESGVEIGDQFTVYRKDKYIGKIVIEKVWRDGASGRSIKELEKDRVKQGDKVTTRVF